MNYFFSLIHPTLVHFPVGLLFAGSVFHLYGAFRNEESVALAGAFNIKLGYFFIFPAFVVGLLGLQEIEVKDAFREYVNRHLLYAFSTFVVFSAALASARFAPKRAKNFLYFSFVALGLYCVLATGYYGGELVHRFGLPSGVVAGGR